MQNGFGVYNDGRRRLFNQGSVLGLSCLVPVLAILAGQVAAGEVSRVDVKDASGGWRGWTDVKEEEGIAFRSTVPTPERPDRSFYPILLPVWWTKDALRPPEGTRFVLSIKYKDVFSAPAWLLCPSGTDGQFGLYTGAFGGANDGKWKTAEIPVAWDLLSRKVAPLNPAENQPEMTRFFINCAQPVPVASVSVRESDGNRAEELSYYATLRDAAFKEQAEKRKSIPYPVAKEPLASGKKLVAFASFPYIKLGPDFKPAKEMIGHPIKIRACINEYQPGSFMVFADGEELKGVSYTLSKLVNERGQELSAEIIPWTAEYVLASRRNEAGAKVCEWTPDRFWPAYAVDVPANSSHWFLFDVKTERGRTTPGVYKGSVEIVSSTEKTSLPVEVKVDNVDLLGMAEANLNMGWSLNSFTPIRDIDHMAEFNQNSALLWYGGSAPGVRLKDGEIEFDCPLVDDWMAAAKKRGMRQIVLFLGGDPYIFPQNLNLLRHLAELKGGGAGETAFIREMGQTRTKVPDSIRPLFVKWLKAFDAHAKTKGWPDIILAPFDEPAKYTRTKKGNDKRPGIVGSGPHIKELFIDCCKIIHETVPAIRVYASIHDEDNGNGSVFADHVDVFCSNAVGRFPVQGERIWVAREKRKNSPRPLEFWQYGASASNPDAARFTCGFFFGGWQSTGLVDWAYNAQGLKFDMSDGGARCAWPTAYRTIPRAGYFGIREGWDDRRLMETFKKHLSGDRAAMDIFEKVCKEARASQSETKGGKDLVNDFWETIDDKNRLDVWRNTLLDRLVQYGSK